MAMKPDKFLPLAALIFWLTSAPISFAQSPKATPPCNPDPTNFNPFSPYNGLPPCGPTPSRKLPAGAALSQVAPTPSDAAIKRNSSVPLNPKPVGQPVAATFANGARVQHFADRLVILDSSGHQTAYRRTATPPA